LDKNSQIFTSEEIEEIELFKEASRNTSINGNLITCFEILSNVINGKVDINSISREELIKLYAQLKAYTQLWEDMIWLDSRLLKKITTKVRSLIKLVLNSR
jgi:hypothetical protein